MTLSRVSPEPACSLYPPQSQFSSFQARFTVPGWKLSDDLASVPNLLEIWRDLVEGRSAIVGHCVDEQSASLFLDRGPARRPSSWRQSHAEMLADVLVGAQQKTIAVDLAVSQSTISQRLSCALQAFGLEGPARRAPLGLAMLAAAYVLGPAFSAPGCRLLGPSDGSSNELCMARPDPFLRPQLAEAEYDVLRAVLAGRSQQQVGDARGRSPRTIANQLHAISEKLGVSGRFQWIFLAVSLSGGRNRCGAEQGHLRG